VQECQGIGKDQTTDLGVRSSNLFGRAISLQNWARKKPAVFALEAATSERRSTLFDRVMRICLTSTFDALR
jgi:hypothetical protein